MKTLYLDCGMGAAGDMLTAALLEVHPDPRGALERLNALGIPGVEFSALPSVRCGLAGTHVSVAVNGKEEDARLFSHKSSHGGPSGHHHAGPDDVARLLSGLALPAAARENALAVYGLVAEAESRVHGRPAADIHFHEVGTLDAVADVAGFSLLMAELDPDQVLASPVHVGCGEARCAHGILPVPAPATAWLLRGIPIYGGEIRGELCTPTGAALLRHFVADFGPMPMMRVERIGYGMGSRDFERANCVRALMGETESNRESLVELSCNLDDMTPEAMGFAAETLLEGGALDVWMTPVHMKKNRPGVILTCLCREADRDAMLRLLFRHTTTLGVREAIRGRYALSRETRVIDSPLGPVRVKRAEGWGVRREKMEYDDLAGLARDRGLSLAETADRAASSLQGPSLRTEG